VLEQRRRLSRPRSEAGECAVDAVNNRATCDVYIYHATCGVYDATCGVYHATLPAAAHTPARRSAAMTPLMQ
jgi:hypothetical protein